MTEFTKDDIEHYRKQYALWTSRRQITPEELHLIARLRDALDHIERLQARVQELEKENNEHWKSTALQLAKNYGVRIHSLEQHIAELEVQLKSKDIIINNQQGRLHYYATKDLFGGKNEEL